MLIPTKVLHSGFQLPVYGLGTWGLGGREKRDYTNDDHKDIDSIQKAIEEGVTLIDTAETYAGGHTEELIGEAIKGYDRNKLLIQSKVFSENVTEKSVINSCLASLKRLNTDYIDVYLLHRFPLSPLEQVISALNFLVKEGIVKHIGVSNFNINQFESAQSLTSHKIEINQLHYNLKIREVEDKKINQYCVGKDVFLQAWRPLEKNMLNHNSPLIKQLIRKYDKTPTQIAINWLVSQENVITISKTSSIDHLRENLGGLTWQMEKEDIELLRKEYPGQLFISPTVPLS